ncbi:MAG: hypothetical protein PHC80_09370, partial [Eubacteriales bacterium]|nr:hypothetical protein [Eubacteriales bacterium]
AMLCMTVFSMLSLLTAKNDETLTEKTVAYTAAYYRADAEAQRVLADIFAAREANAPLPVGVVQSGKTLTYSVPVNEAAMLCVTLQEDDAGVYTVESYGVQPAQTETPQEEPLELWRKKE